MKSETYDKYNVPVAETVQRIEKWNEDRGMTDFDPQLEVRLISEETVELLTATNLPNLLKELADLTFVGTGTMYKDKELVMEDYLNATFDLVSDIVYTYPEMELLQEYDDQGIDIASACVSIVTEANELKGSEKDENGKVVKGPNYVNPEHTITKMLEELRVGY